MLLTKPSFPDDTFLLKNMEPNVYFVSQRRWESECCWGWTALANTTAPSLRADESFQKALFSDAFTHSCSENSNSTKLTSSNCWKLWKKLHPSTSYPLGLDIYISIREEEGKFKNPAQNYLGIQEGLVLLLHLDCLEIQANQDFQLYL